MKISIIAAVARNNAIGIDNKLLYWLPNDLKNFKKLTSGHTILMGRKTFESLPKGALPNRRNIVLSRQKLNLPGCEVYSSIEEALKHCAADEQLYVLGGAKIYEQLIEFADELLLTEVDDVPAKADAFFPNYEKWQEVEREKHAMDEKHGYNYDFVTYIKK